MITNKLNNLIHCKDLNYPKLIFPIGGIITLGGVFFLLASLEILPNGANAISSLEIGGKVGGGILTGLGAFSVMSSIGLLGYRKFKTDSNESGNNAPMPNEVVGRDSPEEENKAPNNLGESDTIESGTHIATIPPEVVEEENRETGNLKIPHDLHASSMNVGSSHVRLGGEGTSTGKEDTENIQAALVQNGKKSSTKRSQFHIQEVQEEEWGEIAELTDTWYQNTKAIYRNLKRTPGNLTVEERAATPKSQAFASYRICKLIKLALKGNDSEKEEGDAWDRVLVCRDETNKIQAVALIEGSSNTLTYLAANPDNLPFAPTEESKKVRGAGTEIILHLAQIALETRLPIRLKATRYSKPFYEKIRFEPELKSKNTKNTTWMYLTPEKIQQLIGEKIPPFDRIADQ